MLWNRIDSQAHALRHVSPMESKMKRKPCWCNAVMFWCMIYNKAYSHTVPCDCYHAILNCIHVVFLCAILKVFQGTSKWREQRAVEVVVFVFIIVSSLHTQNVMMYEITDPRLIKNIILKISRIPNIDNKKNIPANIITVLFLLWKLSCRLFFLCQVLCS